MDLFKIVIIILHITKVLSRKKHTSSSEESIENLLYYKDCQRKGKPEATTPVVQETMQRQVQPQPPPQYACPYPKMCCSLSCNNECESGGGGGGIDFNRMGFPPVQRQGFKEPPLYHMNPPVRKIKPHIPGSSFANFFPPDARRKEGGFTKEKIKTLIQQDGDIKKILKDLVRVTMQKVDLIDILQNKAGGNAMNEAKSPNSEEYEERE